MTAALCLGALLVAAAPATVSAQAVAVARAARFEVAGGGGWFTGSALGGGPADLRARDGGDFTWFAADTRFGAGPVLDVRAGYALSPRYGLEARVAFSRPELRTDISADFEGAPPLTLTERLDRYTIDASVVRLFGDAEGPGLVPFVAAGAGYLRELHEGRTLVEQGIVYHAGGGVRQAFFRRARRALKSMGVRADGRMHVLTEGAGGDAMHLSATAGVFFRF